MPKKMRDQDPIDHGENDLDIMDAMATDNNPPEEAEFVADEGEPQISWEQDLLSQEHAPKGDQKTDFKTALYLVACTRHYMLEEVISNRNRFMLSMLLSGAGFHGSIDDIDFDKVVDTLQELVNEGALVRLQGGGGFCAPAYYAKSEGKVSCHTLTLRVSYEAIETEELRFVSELGEFPLFSRFVVIPGDEIEVEVNTFIKRAYAVRIKNLRTMLVGNCVRKNIITFRDRGLKAFDVRRAKNSLPADTGDMVVCEIVERKSPNILIIKIREVVDSREKLNKFIMTAVLEHNIPNSWPETVQLEAKEIPEVVDQDKLKGRVDLRDLPLVTIDGEDARDFDDAVYCEKVDGKFHLYVAIADVSYYVRTGSAINQEALLRCNSVYFPYFVIPMLPEELSNGICSLNPKVDRCCMVCEMTIGAKGKIEKYDFYPAVMNSHARLTYTEAHHMIQEGKPIKEEHAMCVPWVKSLYELYLARKEDRVKRGAFEFESPEVSFLFDKNWNVCGMEPEVRNEAHMLIEECMIAANICAASFVVKHKAQSLFRVHDRPTPEKLDKLRSILSRYGIDLPGGYEPTPEDFKKVAAQVERLDDGVHQIISLQLLRSMSKAVYSPENIGHFGLALEDYAHFTSPIRRYADLQLHREIKYILEKTKKRTWGKIGAQNYGFEELEHLGNSCSAREKAAADAEFDVDNSLKCEFVKNFEGEAVKGTISTISNFGVFVTLNDFYIDGMLEDSFLRREENISVHTANGQTYCVGEQIDVRIMQVDSSTRRITLSLIQNFRKKDSNFDIKEERDRLAQNAEHDYKIDNSKKLDFFDRLSDISRGAEAKSSDIVNRASLNFNIDTELEEASKRVPQGKVKRSSKSKSVKGASESNKAVKSSDSVIEDLSALAAAESAGEEMISDMEMMLGAIKPSKSKKSKLPDELADEAFADDYEQDYADPYESSAVASAAAAAAKAYANSFAKINATKPPKKSKAHDEVADETAVKASKTKVTKSRVKKAATEDPLLDDTAFRIDADLNQDMKKASTKTKGKAKSLDGTKEASNNFANDEQNTDSNAKENASTKSLATKTAETSAKKSSKSKSNAKSKQEVLDEKELAEEKQVSINEATTVVVKKRSCKTKKVSTDDAKIEVAPEDTKTASEALNSEEQAGTKAKTKLATKASVKSEAKATTKAASAATKSNAKLAMDEKAAPTKKLADENDSSKVSAKVKTTKAHVEVTTKEIADTKVTVKRSTKAKTKVLVEDDSESILVPETAPKESTTRAKAAKSSAKDDSKTVAKAEAKVAVKSASKEDAKSSSKKADSDSPKAGKASSKTAVKSVAKTATKALDTSVDDSDKSSSKSTAKAPAKTPTKAKAQAEQEILVKTAGKATAKESAKSAVKEEVAAKAYKSAAKTGAKTASNTVKASESSSKTSKKESGNSADGASKTVKSSKSKADAKPKADAKSEAKATKGSAKNEQATTRGAKSATKAAAKSSAKTSAKAPAKAQAKATAKAPAKAMAKEPAKSSAKAATKPATKTATKSKAK